MEPDFSIRNELDSISHRDESLDSVLSRYPESAASKETTPTNAPVIGSMLSNLQSSLGFLHRDNQFIKSKLGDSSDEAGVKLVVGAETLKWIVLLLIILIGLVLFFNNKKKRKNPLKKRLLALETEIRSLKRQNPFNG